MPRGIISDFNDMAAMSGGCPENQALKRLRRFILWHELFRFQFVAFIRSHLKKTEVV